MTTKYPDGMIMKLYVAKNGSIADIQHQFNVIYPYLKIEFISNEQPLKFHPVINAGSVNIGSGRIVKDVENDFRQLSGLHAEIYRKSGNVWIATSLTKDWTLQQQNNEGKLISNICI